MPNPAEERVLAIEARRNAATKGPWRPCPQKSFIFGPKHEMIASRLRGRADDEPEDGTVEIRGFGGGLPMDANHDFIVESWDDVGFLIDELRKAWAALPTVTVTDRIRRDAVRARNAVETAITDPETRSAALEVCTDLEAWLGRVAEARGWTRT